MSNSENRNSRRDFIRLAGMAGVAAAVGSVLTRPAFAADLPHLAETDATAQALGYKEDATKVDKVKYATYKPGSQCSNCKFYQGGTGFGPCQLFPGKAVSEKGWCSGYAAK